MIEHLAVVGATGVVGREFLNLVGQRSLPTRRITLLATERSAGLRLRVGDADLTVESLSTDRLNGVSVAVFCADAKISREYAPVVVRAGGVVVDNSSAFRMSLDVPLIVPEVNIEDMAGHRGIIANPNCTTIIMLMAVAPIHRAFPVKRIVVSTYQAASGAGRPAMEELEQQSRDHLAGRAMRSSVFPHPIAFNLFAHDSSVNENGYNEEERKVIAETRKILHEPDLAITATCVRVPVLRAHSESINLSFRDPIALDEIRDILASTPGLKVVDDRERSHFPMPIEATGCDDVLVGRIRADVSQPDGLGLDLFVCGDQLRKGAALNAIQIVESLIRAAV